MNPKVLETWINETL
jgi:hypothetical protein